MNHIPGLHGHKRAGSSGSGQKSGSHSRNSSGPNVQPVPQSPQELNQMLARQHEIDKEKIVRSCFSKVDENSVLLESYITHVRITEDSHYPSTRPPPSSPESAKKKRAIIISVRKSSKVRIHKARENPNGSFQIGKTWNMDDLTRIENDTQSQVGFTVHLGKPYYWQVSTSRERDVFLNSLVKIYKRYTNGKLPELAGLDDIIDRATRTSTFSDTSQRLSDGSGSTTTTAPHQPIVATGSPTIRQVDEPNDSAQSSKLLKQSQTQVQSQPQPQLQPPSHQTHQPRQPNGIQPLSATHGSTPLGFVKGPSPTQVGTYRTEIPSESLAKAHTGGGVQTAHAAQQEPVLSQQARPPQLAGSALTGLVLRRDSDSICSVTSSASASKASNGARRAHSPASVAATTTLAASAVAVASITGSSEILQQPTSKSTALTGPRLMQLQPPSQRVRQPSVSQPSGMDRGATEERQAEQMAGKAPQDANVRQNQKEPANGRTTTSATLRSDQKVNVSEALVATASAAVIAQATTNGQQLKETGTSRSFGNAIISERPSQASGEAPISTRRGHHESKASVSSIASQRSRRSGRRLSLAAVGDATAVEETLSEFSWTGKEDVSALAAKISTEIAELESQTFHDVVDLDGRLDELDSVFDAAIDECERLDGVMAFFSVQLGCLGDDISYIESQGHGLQVQTTNQKILWNELNSVLAKVSIPDETLRYLTSAQFDSPQDISRIEQSLCHLYDAVRAVRISDEDKSSGFLGSMRALKEKRHVYEQVTTNFVDRFRAFSEAKFRSSFEASIVAAADRVDRQRVKSTTTSTDAEPLRIGRVDVAFMQSVYPLAGIVLFIKETDTESYYSLLKFYENLAAPYYDSSVTSFFSSWKRSLSALLSTSGTKQQFTFSPKQNFPNSPVVDAASSGVPSRSKTLRRSGTLASKFKSSTSSGDSNRDSLGSLPNGSDEQLITISSQSSAQIRSFWMKLLEDIIETIVSQQEVVIKLFHLSSFGATGFPEFIHQVPVEKRLKYVSTSLNVRGIDSDRVKAQEVLGFMSAVLGSIHDKAVANISSFFTSTYSLGCPAMILAIEAYHSEFESTNQDFLVQVLQKFRDSLVSGWNKYISEQVQSINSTFLTAKKRSGIVYFIKALPAFCNFIEDDLEAQRIAGKTPREELPVRRLVNEAYDRLFKATFSCLQRVSSDSGGSRSQMLALRGSSQGLYSDYEDKEQLNYHILMIENMNWLKEHLDGTSNGTIAGFVTFASATFKTELEQYIKIVIHRPLGKLIDFVSGVEMIADKNPAEKHGYTRAALKKVLSDYDAKDVAKGIETLKKRVEKHFIEEDRSEINRRLLERVLLAIQAEYSSFYTRLTDIINRYYEPGDREALLEFRSEDIVEAFRK